MWMEAKGNNERTHRNLKKRNRLNEKINYIERDNENDKTEDRI
jgi:hypothetical protein